MAVIALIVAAGRGLRAGAGGPKQYRDLNGQPVLRRTVRAFLDCEAVDACHVVINPADRAAYEAAVAGLSLPAPTDGGATRQASVRAGLESLDLLAGDVVLIHDAARPFVSARVIDDVIAAVGPGRGACPALPVTDTIRMNVNGHAGRTLDRDQLSAAQTPQGFTFSDILHAHRAQAAQDLTDDVAVAQAQGLDVRLTPGDPANVKLTTAEDFRRAQQNGAQQNGAQMDEAMTDIRIGQGFDVHAFEPGDGVILCGVTIPFDQRLKGHSDADVAMHAITDALFGAIAEGDIGRWFPPSEPEWKGADSRIFLEKAAERIAARDGRITNIDLTVICQAPKIGPHAAEMTARIAEIVGIDAARVSVKATTSERLGFTGRGEGIAAMASATVLL